MQDPDHPTRGGRRPASRLLPFPVGKLTRPPLHLPSAASPRYFFVFAMNHFKVQEKQFTHLEIFPIPAAGRNFRKGNREAPDPKMLRGNLPA